MLECVLTFAGSCFSCISIYSSHGSPSRNNLYLWQVVKEEGKSHTTASTAHTVCWNNGEPNVMADIFSKPTLFKRHF